MSLKMDCQSKFNVRIKSGDRGEDGFDYNALERMLQDFTGVDFGGGSNVQLNASEAAEDKSIYDAKIESEEREGNAKDIGMFNGIVTEEKALKEQEEKAKAACDINAFKPMLQDSGSMIFSRGGSMERTSKEKKVFDCEGEANMLGYNRP